MKMIYTLLQKLRGEPDLNKLRKRGLKTGKNFKMMGRCIIDPSHCWHIEIGDNVTLAPQVHILAHDASTKIFLGYTKVANVKIGNNVFIGAGSIILPGVTIGNDVVIGAGSLVNSDIPDNTLAAGVPAKLLGKLDDYLAKEEKAMHAENCFNESYTLRNSKWGNMQRNALLDAAEKFGKIYLE